MRHKIPHDLPFKTALKATHAALDSYKAQFSEFSPGGRWVTEDTAHIQFRAAGKTMEGKVYVTSSAVELEMTVPFLLRPFKAIALQVVEGEIQTWLDRARAGEFDPADR